MARMSLVVYGTEPGTSSLKVETDTGGRFVVEGVAAGRITFAVDAPAYVPIHTMTLDADELVDVRIVLDPRWHSIHGKVSDGDGSALGGIVLCLTAARVPPPTSVEGCPKTDADGTFSLHLPSFPPYDLLVRAPGFERYSQTVESTDDYLGIYLDASIRDRERLSPNPPVVNASIASRWQPSESVCKPSASTSGLVLGTAPGGLHGAPVVPARAPGWVGTAPFSRDSIGHRRRARTACRDAARRPAARDPSALGSRWPIHSASMPSTEADGAAARGRLSAIEIPCRDRPPHDCRRSIRSRARSGPMTRRQRLDRESRVCAATGRFRPRPSRGFVMPESCTGWQSLLDAMEGIAFVVDRSGLVTAAGSRNWNAFARSNGAPELDASVVVGRDLFDFVSGADVRKQLGKVMTRIAADPNDFTVIPFRCDSPGLRRNLRQSIRPIVHGESCTGFVFQSIELDARERPPIDLFDFKEIAKRREQEASLPVVVMCSWCQRVRFPPITDGDWYEAEAYYSAGGGSEVGLSHSICDRCATMVGTA